MILKKPSQSVILKKPSKSVILKKTSKVKKVIVGWNPVRWSIIIVGWNPGSWYIYIYTSHMTAIFIINWFDTILMI